MADTPLLPPPTDRTDLDKERDVGHRVLLKGSLVTVLPGDDAAM